MNKEKFFKSLALSEARNLIYQNSGNNDFIVIDVRKAEELAGGVLGQPVNMDIYLPDFAGKSARCPRKNLFDLLSQWQPEQGRSRTDETTGF